QTAGPPQRQSQPDCPQSRAGNPLRHAASRAGGEFPGNRPPRASLLRAQAARAGYLRSLRATQAQLGTCYWAGPRAKQIAARLTPINADENARLIGVYQRSSAAHSFFTVLLWQKPATVFPARRQKGNEAGRKRTKPDACAGLNAGVACGEHFRAGTACAVGQSRRIAGRDGSDACRQLSARRTARSQSCVRRASELSNR